MSVSFRFIHAADLHVDSPFKGLSDAPPQVRDTLLASTFEAAGRLVDCAIAAQADFVVIAGDLYDAADRSLRAQLALQREWQRLHAHGVRLFVIHGNHDHLGGARAGLDWPDSVTVFGSGGVEWAPAYRRDGQLAAYVYGMSYGARAVTDNIASRYKPVPDGPYHIALLHANVDGNPAYDPYAPCTLAELRTAGFNYWALGHIHTRAVLGTYPHVVYSGNIQGRHVRESGAKGCYVVDVKASGETELDFVPLDSVRFETAHVAINGLRDEQSLMDALERAAAGTVAESEGRSVMLRLVLDGRGPLHRTLTDAGFARDLLGIVRERLEGEAALQGDEPGRCWVTAIDVATGSEIDREALAAEDSFAGETVRIAAALETDDAGRAALLGDALAPLLASGRLRKMVRERMDVFGAEWLRRAGELTAGLLVADMEAAVSTEKPEIAYGESTGADKADAEEN